MLSSTGIAEAVYVCSSFHCERSFLSSSHCALIPFNVNFQAVGTLERGRHSLFVVFLFRRGVGINGGEVQLPSSAENEGATPLMSHHIAQ